MAASVLEGTASAPLAGPPVDAAAARSRLRTWLLGLLHVAVAVGAYALYAVARDAHGAATATSYRIAKHHAEQVVRVERFLHLPHERWFQGLTLHHRDIALFFNGYYGGLHLSVTTLVLAWLLIRKRRHYPMLAGVLAVATAIGLVVFLLYPTLPPRLLPGGTTDTLARFGGLWSYDSGSLEHITDPYAAMPSLHLVWATWCALAVWVAGGARTVRRAALCALYPVLTAVTVLVTGMHYQLDIVAGTGLTLGVAWVMRDARRRWRAAQKRAGSR